MKSTEEAAEPENDDGVWSGDVPHSHQLLGDSPYLNDDPLLKWFNLQVRSIHFIIFFCQSSVLLLQVFELLICLNGTQAR